MKYDGYANPNLRMKIESEESLSCSEDFFKPLQSHSYLTYWHT